MKYVYALCLCMHVFSDLKSKFSNFLKKIFQKIHSNNLNSETKCKYNSQLPPNKFEKHFSEKQTKTSLSLVSKTDLNRL